MANPKEKPKMAIPTREPGKKKSSGAFDNIRPIVDPNQSADVDEILGFNNLASQQAIKPTSQIANKPDSHLSNVASHLPNVASHLPNAASHLPNAASQIASSDDEVMRLASQVASKPDSQLASKPTLSPQYLHEKTLKSRRDKMPLNSRIDYDLYDAVLELGTVIGGNIQEMVSEALDDLIFKYLGKRVLKSVASQLASLPAPTLIKEFSKLELLNLFAKVSGKNVSTRNRKLFDQAYKNFHPLLIELGIREAALSVQDKGGELYSFQYCINAMAYRIDWDLESISNELARHRAGNWQQ